MGELNGFSSDVFEADWTNRIIIRHRLGKIVAFIEIVSPGNKDGAPALKRFVEKVVESLHQGVHVLVIDPFPPTPRDPFGIHKAIRDCIEEEEFDLPADQSRILASYEGDRLFTGYIETVGVGETLPDIPLFIAPGAHVKVPLENIYGSVAGHSRRRATIGGSVALGHTILLTGF
jgi:hypothetical protein